jgi:hypothetical protein
LHDTAFTSSDIKKELLDDINRTDETAADRHISLLDERSIDFVGLMFDAIEKDDTVSQLIVNLVRRLQIPVIKLAMIDSNLFAQQQHPARITIDLLVSAGKGINNDKDSLYLDLVSVVNTILEQFESDVSVFEKAIACINFITERESRLSQETEKQQQQQVLLEHARHIVASQIKIFARSRKIPDKLKLLVLKHWASLMVNRYLQYGRNSQQWLHSVSLLKLMLKCMQPVRFQSQYDMLKANHTMLVETLQDELYATRQDQQAISGQLSLLATHYSRLLETYNHNEISSTGNSHNMEGNSNSTDNDDYLVDVDEQIESPELKTASIPDSIKPGIWYEIFSGEGKPVRRLKLSVVIHDTGNLVFVDRKGLKVLEKEAKEFEQELLKNRSRIMADHSTFDSALWKVIGSIAA